jgi:hypothetical protein
MGSQRRQTFVPEKLEWVWIRNLLNKIKVDKRYSTGWYVARDVLKAVNPRDDYLRESTWRYSLLPILWIKS